jgi:hypothetical protein
MGSTPRLPVDGLNQLSSDPTCSSEGYDGNGNLIQRYNGPYLAYTYVYEDENRVSGHSKPARDGRMKTSHFESGIAQKAAIAATLRNEPTQCEPANELGSVL